MKFWEAMKALEEGKRVRKKNWNKQSWIDRNSSHCGQTYEIPLPPSGDEWELYEEPERTLSFLEVVAGLKEGKKFRRMSWHSEFIVKIEPMTGFILFSQPIFPQDFLANDWIEVRE